MPSRRIFIAMAGAGAALVAWQTIQAVGSYVPVEERRWVPPTVAAGMDDAMMIAGHSSGGAAAGSRFDIIEEADGVTARRERRGGAVDLSALHYFAGEGDTEAMRREIARIERLNPGFEVPEAMRRPGARTDESALWARLDEGKLEAVRRRIDRLEQSKVTPSPALTAALRAAETRKAIEVAVGEARWRDAIAAAEAAPNLLDCADVETLWRLARAYDGLGKTERALAVHAFVITHCQAGDVRAGSISRALDVSAAGTEATILPILKRGRARDGEVEMVRRGVARRVVAAGLETPAPASAGTDGAAGGRCGDVADLPEPAARRTDDERGATDQAVEALAELAEGADDATLLGWHHYAAGRFEAAQRWFDDALAIEERRAAVEGAILARLALGERGPALAMALDRQGDDNAACLALAVATEDLADGDARNIALVERLTRRFHAAASAEVLGWHHLDRGRTEAARAWFSRALEWHPTSDAAMGIVVASERAGDGVAARATAARWGQRFEQVAAYARDMARRTLPVPAANPARVSDRGPMVLAPEPAEVLLGEALAAYEGGDFARAAERLDARRALYGEPRDLALLRGWALHNAGQSRDAWRLFSALDTQRSTAETRKARISAWQRLMPARFH